MSSDLIVYDDGLGHYIGFVTLADGRGDWYRWPAVCDGWRERKTCKAPDPETDAVFEYDDWQARLALALSGVEQADVS